MAADKQKSVQRGILWVAIASIALMCVCLAGYYFVQSRMLQKQKEAAHVQRSSLVGRLLGISSEKFVAPLKDITSWDELYYAAKDRDLPAAEECVGYMPETYGAAAVAVFDDAGSLMFDSIVKKLPESIYGIDGEKLTGFFRKPANTSFTMNIEGRLFNFIGQGIVPTDDEYTRVEPPSGYVVLVKELIEEEVEEHCKSLGDFGARIFTSKDSMSCYIGGLEGLDHVEYTLTDYSGRETAFICFTYPDPSASLNDDLARMFIAVCLQVLIIILIVLIYVNRKITRPLRKISKAFRTDSIEPVRPLDGEDNEFGQISRMMEGFFDQKEKISAQNETLSQQKEELNQQKEEIQSQNEQMAGLNKSLAAINKQMTDSITYASRLQGSMLLARQPGEGWFRGGFTIYHPKNIVGGDFYMARTSGHYHLAILGDCTGHGVPGAILASLGMAFLDQIIESQDFDFMPDTLLNRLRVKVIDAFGVDGEGKRVDDGMDAAAVIYNQQTGEAHFAGAGRPAVIVRDRQLIVHKGDRMPVGHYVRNDSFTRTRLLLMRGDAVFLYSDGCTDQVGGPKGRKLTTGNFQQMLLNVAASDFSTWKQKIEDFLRDWRGSKLQSDDISLLAFRM